MDRRSLLAATGAIVVASMAGCLGELDDDDPGADNGDDGDDNPGADNGDDGDDDDDGVRGDDAGTHDEPPTADPDVADAVLAELAEGNAMFALDLYRRLAAMDDESLFFSPYSISAALAMTYAGAEGETAAEMEEVLHYTLEDDVHEAFAGIAHELADREEIEDELDGDEVDAFILRVVNALWGREGYPWRDEFLETLDEYYGAGLREADFEGNPDGERERINDWVADATEDRIDELLPAGSIPSNTVFVITNAIYFLASWLSEFDPEETEDEPFTALDGMESTVPMMHQYLEAGYAELDDVRALELQYVGGDVSMVLMLPDEGTFTDFEEFLDADRLFSIFDEISRAEGHVALPRFEIESEVQLSEVLVEMGMERAFGDANFGGMVDNGGGIWLDEVYHDAFVSVDEQGTEAAAATAVVGVDSVPPDWGELRFDRPFVFCIRDRPTDSVLFLGRVTAVDGE